MPSKSKSSKRGNQDLIPFALTPRRIAYAILSVVVLGFAGYYSDVLSYGWFPVIAYVLATVYLYDRRRKWLREHARPWAATSLTIPAAVVLFSMSNQGGGSAGRFLTDDGNMLFVIVELLILSVTAVMVIAPDSVSWVKQQAEGLSNMAPGKQPEPVVASQSTGTYQQPVPQSATMPSQPVAEPVVPVEHTPPPPSYVPGPTRQWSLPSTGYLKPQTPYLHSREQAAQMREDIERVLRQYGVKANVGEVVEGPRVTRFGILPGSNVRIKEISNLHAEFALALRSSNIRIVDQPELGAGLVWLDVPNSSNNTVMLRGVVESPAFQELWKGQGLPVALGVDTVGQPMTLDLTAAPHLLLAGATGSGKSVCINTLITSLLLTRTPDQVRLTLVDPKRVELMAYNKIPHLAQPIITEPDAVPDVLHQMVVHMERRYDAMAARSARNIAAYNARASQKLPYEVLVVDEMADLIMQSGKLVEDPLVRLAQLGRAAGFHVVVATQRPSVNVVTGILKANIPTRVAFAVASQVDSRVILDTGGAERLMGRGDLLLSSSTAAEPAWGHGAYVSDEEIDGVTGFWASQR